MQRKQLLIVENCCFNKWKFDAESPQPVYGKVCNVRWQNSCYELYKVV